jgi:hypothetical protein
MVTAVERGHAARLAADLKVGKYGNHFPNDTFVPLAVETYGCLDSAFDGFLGTGARLALDGPLSFGQEAWEEWEEA